VPRRCYPLRGIALPEFQNSVTASPESPLRDFYPHYRNDTFIEAADGVERLLREFDLLESAYLRRLYRHKAHYSLDRGDGVENTALCRTPSPAEEYERKEALTELYAAIASLPDKQAKRIYAHFFLGMSKAEIARAEEVSAFTVRQSIVRALASLRKKLKDFDGTGFSFR
jgi:RNA polymerase sigma-70 factor (ECF subfamily)